MIIEAFDDSEFRKELIGKCQMEHFEAEMKADMALMLDCPWRPAFPCGCPGLLAEHCNNCNDCGEYLVCSYMCSHAVNPVWFRNGRSNCFDNSYCRKCYEKAVTDFERGSHRIQRSSKPFVAPKWKIR